MKDLAGKTAVITGAASGMGRAFAERFAAAGMNVVLADVEVPRLEEAAAAVAAEGVETIAVPTDVSDADAVERLRDAALARFGRVHVVCNNAGVAGSMSGTGVDLNDWRWVLGVNLWGVIHGHRSFLPHLIEHGDGHIVNTASMAGLHPGHSAYTASKWAVVALSRGPLPAARGAGFRRRCLVPVPRLGRHGHRHVGPEPPRVGGPSPARRRGGRRADRARPRVRPRSTEQRHAAGAGRRAGARRRRRGTLLDLHGPVDGHRARTALPGHPHGGEPAGDGGLPRD